MPPRNTASACHTAWTESTSPSWKGTDEYYTFYYSTDLVTCVVRSSGMADNTDGNPYLSAIDTSVVSIAYHSGRTVDTIAHLDASGKPVFFMNYPAGLEPYHLVIDGVETDITRCIYTYDEIGHLTEITYKTDSRNTPSASRRRDTFRCSCQENTD